MSRLFLTVEDLNRAGGKDVWVDEGTVVTPQAQEAARAAGIAIRTPSGVWSEPMPDRGPDAERAARQLPNLPEPTAATGDGSTPTGFVVTAVGKNRPGVLAEITAALGEGQAGIRDISQRMVEGYFHLILTVETPGGMPFDELKARLQCLGGEDDYVVRVMHERVFRFMHRI